MLRNIERYDNIITYERKKRKMSTAANNQTNQNSNQQNSQSNPQNGEIRNGLENANSIMKTINTLLAIIVVISGGIIYAVANIVAHGKDIEYLKGEVSGIKGDVAEINNRIDDIGKTTDKNYETFLELSSMSRDEEAYNIVFKDAYQVKTETIKNEEYLAQPVWDDESVIASDIEGDIVYTAEDLYNTLIITSYQEGNNEVYFYGRFNENNHWNGKCILNVYNGNNLVSIFEGMYNNGELFSYKRIAEGEDSTWIVNDRKRQGDYNSGETWTYKKTEEFVKGFTAQNIKDKQILTIDKFLNSINKKIVGYYKGNTSENLYNDQSGNAYTIRYDDAGNVRYFYKGKISNGYGNDDGKDENNKSWAFIWGDANDGFHYHEGQFENGHPKNTNKDWKYPKDQDFIKSKINPDHYDCPLTGLID